MPRFLSDSDHAVLKDMIRWFKSQRLNADREGRNQERSGPDVYLAEAPPAGIPAAAAGTPGKADCDLWSVNGVETLSLDTLDEAESTPFQFEVVNPISEDIVGSGAPNLIAIRAKDGHYIAVPLPNALQEVITKVRIDETEDKIQYKNRQVLAFFVNDESDWIDLAAFEDC